MGVGRLAVNTDATTVGVLTAFIAYIGRFYTRLDSMSRIVSATQRAAAGAQRIFEILDRVPSVPEPMRPVASRAVSQGRIELRGVSLQLRHAAGDQGLNLSISSPAR